MPSTSKDIRKYYKENIREFMKDCLRIQHRNPNITGLVPFELNPAQEALLTLKEQIEKFNIKRTTYMAQFDKSVQITHLPVRINVLKPRKEGISTLIEAIMYHHNEFNPHSKGLIMAHREDGAHNIASISTRFTRFFPVTEPEFKMKMYKNNSKAIEWDQEHDSGMFICTCANENVARSHTFRIVHLSELAHFGNGDAIAAANEACGDFPIFFKETTANGLDAYFYPSWDKAMYFEDVKAYWDEHKATPPDWNGEYKFFWGWWQDPEYRSPVSPEERKLISEDLDEEEKALIEAYGLSIEQIKWRRGKIAGSATDQKKLEPIDFFRQEYPANPEEAFVTTGTAVFQRSALTRLEAQRQKPEWHGKILLMKEGQIILQEQEHNRWWFSNLVKFERPREGHEYVIGGDAAEGLKSGDWSVASVWDRTDGSNLVEVARYRGKAGARLLGDIIAYLSAHYNDAYVMMEANAPGNSTCQRLVEIGVAEMYHRKNEEAVGQDQDKEVWSPGFKTYANTKRLIIERARAALRDKELTIRHPDALREWRLYANEDGRLGAPPGENDDCVMADCLAIYAHFVTAPAILRAPPPEVPQSPKDAQSIRIQDLVRKKIKKSQLRHKQDRLRPLKALPPGKLA